MSEFSMAARCVTLKRMPKCLEPSEKEIDLLFQALADPSRRAMVDRLTRGPASVSELARPLAMSLPAVVQHLHLLEASGLVRTEKLGRMRTCWIEANTLRTAEAWVAERRTAWEQRLDRLGDFLAEETNRPDQERTSEHHREVHQQPLDDPLDVRDRTDLRSKAGAGFRRIVDQAAKTQWFGPSDKQVESYSLDFREGGREHLSSPRPTAPSTASTPSTRTSCRPADRPHLRHAPRRRPDLGIRRDDRIRGGRRYDALDTHRVRLF